jgi:hypothetical protein
LTEAEKTAGWRLLFDGENASAFVSIGTNAFPTKGWTVQEGLLSLAEKGGGKDLVTKETFLNFELVWEWKLAVAGNSGVKYNLIAPDKGIGFEYQLLDDVNHPDARARGRFRQTGSLYDLLEAPEVKKLNPPGEWNQSSVLVNGNHVEHWLNGQKTLAFEIGSDAMRERIAASKYKKIAEFGVKKESPILLQDHGNAVSFRVIKIRPLAPSPK